MKSQILFWLPASLLAKGLFRTAPHEPLAKCAIKSWVYWKPSTNQKTQNISDLNNIDLALLIYEFL